jgi:PPM family protein phosphatase
MNDLLMSGLTDPGRVRPENEDSIGTRPEIGLAVLADGMGGHQAGEVASGMAVEVVTRHFLDAFTRQNVETGANDVVDNSLEVKATGEAIRLANAAIYELAQTRRDYAGMGSTIAVAVFHENRVCIGHVGDSRIYRFRGGILEQLTEDHSVVQELLNRGLVTPEEARTTISKNLVTRALGVDPDVTPDVMERVFQREDVYLLCSDGLNEVLEDGDIELLLMEHGRNLQEAAIQMIAKANERGGPDNISVILALVPSEFTRKVEAARRLQESLNKV